jgi:hypothetical protein
MEWYGLIPSDLLLLVDFSLEVAVLRVHFELVISHALLYLDLLRLDSYVVFQASVVTLCGAFTDDHIHIWC